MQTKPIPWRERALLTYAETGEILSHSQSWVRDQVAQGNLRARRFAKGGPMFVTVQSVVKLVDELTADHDEDDENDDAITCLVWPRLVWVNPMIPPRQ